MFVSSEKTQNLSSNFGSWAFFFNVDKAFQFLRSISCQILKQNISIFLSTFLCTAIDVCQQTTTFMLFVPQSQWHELIRFKCQIFVTFLKLFWKLFWNSWGHFSITILKKLFSVETFFMLQVWSMNDLIMNWWWMIVKMI